MILLFLAGPVAGVETTLFSVVNVVEIPDKMVNEPKPFYTNIPYSNVLQRAICEEAACVRYERSKNARHSQLTAYKHCIQDTMYLLCNQDNNAERIESH